MTESEKFLNKILTYVDDSDKKWFMCHKADIKAYAKIYHREQLTLTDVSKRYDVSKYTPPFRVGRKQGKAVLDGTGREVIFFSDSEEQAKMYCDYLNNVC